MISLALHLIAALLGGLFIVQVAEIDNDALITEIIRVAPPPPKRTLPPRPVAQFNNATPTLNQPPRLQQPVTTAVDIPTGGARFTLPSSDIYAVGDAALSASSARSLGASLERKLITETHRAEIISAAPNIAPQRMIPSAATQIESALPQAEIASASIEAPPMEFSDTTQAPNFLYKAPPQYPELARRAGKEGVVLLDALIDVDGEAKDIIILKSAGFGLDEAAIQALKASRFAPARQGRLPVAVRVQIPYRFKLEA
jgi:TonB family protein